MPSAEGMPTIIEATIVDKFRAGGFKIRELRNLKQKIDRSVAIQELDNNPQYAKKLALQLGVDLIIVIKGHVSYAKNIKQSRGQLVSVNARVTSKAIRTDTAEYLSGAFATAPSVHVDPYAAGETSLKKATSQVADKLIKDILTKWVQESEGNHLIEIQVTGVTTYDQLLSFKRILQEKCEDVNDVYESEFLGNSAILEIEANVDAFKIASCIQLQKFGLFKAIIKNTSKNRIEVKLKSN